MREQQRPRSHWADRIMAGVAVIALVVSMCGTIKQQKVTDQTLHLSQRAWIVVDALIFLGSAFEVGRDNQKIQIVWKNTGQGPARNVRTYANNVRVVPPEKLPDIRQMADNDHKPESVIGLMGPGSTTTMVVTVKDLSAREWDQVAAGTRILSVVSRALYTDVFGIDHWTTYCSFFNVPEKRFDLCEEGNDSDPLG